MESGVAPQATSLKTERWEISIHICHSVVWVYDEGIGIPVDEQSNLFEKYFRAGNATNVPGTGLGLNIVKRYVELLHGDISFTSFPNSGTEFTLHLPRRAAAVSVAKANQE